MSAPKKYLVKNNLLELVDLGHYQAFTAAYTRSPFSETTERKKRPKSMSTTEF